MSGNLGGFSVIHPNSSAVRPLYLGGYYYIRQYGYVTVLRPTHTLDTRTTACISTWHIITRSPGRSK